PTIHVPTLIVVGAEDTLTPPVNAEQMHRAIAGSELVQIQGAGHLANLEAPESFDAAVARFLSHRVWSNPYGCFSKSHGDRRVPGRRRSARAGTLVRRCPAQVVRSDHRPLCEERGRLLPRPEERSREA